MTSIINKVAAKLTGTHIDDNNKHEQHSEHQQPQQPPHPVAKQQPQPSPQSNTQTDARSTLERDVLHYLNDHTTIDNTHAWLTQYHNQTNVTHDDLLSVIKSLASEDIVKLTTTDSEQWALTAEAQSYLQTGTPEYQLYHAVSTDSAGSSKTEVESKLTPALVAIGQTQCMIQKWLTFDKATKSYIRSAQPDTVIDTVQQQLQTVHTGNATQLDSKQIDNLKKRKMIVKQKLVRYAVSKGSNFTVQRKRVVHDLTSDMIRTGEWQSVQFKPYNLNALGTPLQAGHLHPLMKVRAEFRAVLFGMGFSEMSTNQYVESSFWNFDALFQPQNHPARDAQDTFFIKEPSNTVYLPDDYVEKVKAAHENGGDTGSIGYRYDWKREEAMKNVLRTHTTAVSTRMLYKVANQTDEHGNKIPFRPVKWFSIDRVFRNETLDATHLAEFHQVEGVVADRGLTLSDLIGTIEAFFNRCGISNLRFKPAYNPYTEPSMEIFGFSVQLNRWLEVGNSGMFRPEMLLPMGLPPDVRVIAWGLSLERPTMIKYGIKNIRDLFGHKVKLDIIRNNPIARYDSYLPAFSQSHHVQNSKSKLKYTAETNNDTAGNVSKQQLNGQTVATSTVSVS